MSAHHDVFADRSRGLIRASVSGFFTVDDVAAFERGMRAALERLACGPNRHLTLCDASDMRIQSQDVVAAFAALTRDPSLRSHRIAFVLGQSLARMQTRRLAHPSRTGVGYFDTAAAAEAWLFDGDVAVVVTTFPYTGATLPIRPGPGGIVQI